MAARTDTLALAIANCDREPIHIPGTIQPFGCLIATDLLLETITHLSDNVSEWFPVQTSQLLGQSISDLIADDFVHDLRNAASFHNLQHQRYRLGQRDVDGTLLDISLHQSGDHLIVELEPLDVDPLRSGGTITRVQSMLGFLQGDLTSDMLLQRTVTVLRHVTHFDRVMAYRFLHDGSGEVIAESCSSHDGSYLGLRYPSIDIPQTVRELALKTSLRIIADLSAQPVFLLSHEDQIPLDLSLTHVRSVSPFHVEYLTNMGVSASMTIALIVHGKLWGLLACHHFSPKLLSPDLRSSCEIFAHIFSLHLQEVLTKERLQKRKQIASTTRHLLETSRETFHFIQSAEWLRETLCPILRADGLAVVAQDQAETSGDTPAREFVLDLIHQCQAESANDVIPIEQLRNMPGFSDQATRGKSAGALVIKLSEIEQLYIIFFRNEVASKIHWSGKPEAEIVEGECGPYLRPRASFAEYIETVTGHCPPWSSIDIDIALELRTGLLYLAISHIEVIQQEALQQQRQQDLLIAELNHRVKNILALIRSITRQTQGSATSIADYASTLEKRISALASAHDLVAGHGLEWPQLRELIRIEMRPYLAEPSSRIQLSGPQVGLKANFVPTFILVLHELAANAAKYGSLSVPEGQVEVCWSKEHGGLTISWRERHGPPVASPTRKGFGRQLIERSIAYEFDGKADLRFLPTGVEAEFWVPNEYVLWQSSGDSLPSVPALSTTESQDFCGGRVLLVEDNLLIAMELEAMLQALGFQQIDTAPRVSASLKLLKDQQYSLALLDIDLKGETSFAIAETLLSLKIPFLFTTGFDSKYLIPKQLEHIVRLQKPVNPEQLRQVLVTLIET